MPRKQAQSSRKATAGAAKLRLRRRWSPWAAVGPLLRSLAFWGLIIAVVIGGYQWLLVPRSVGALEFTQHPIVAPGKAAGVLGVAVGDMDGDGDQDIVAVGKEIKVYQNNGKQTFIPITVESIAAERVQLIDLDGDGALDLLVRLAVSPGVKWYHNEGNMIFTAHTLGTGNAVAVWGGDIDGDGDNDVVSATNEGGSIVLRRWMNNGSGSFTSVTLHAESKVSTITIGDVTGGDYAEIITGGGSGLQFWRTNDGHTWSRVDLDEKNQNRTYLAIGDINNDGLNDIIAADQEKDIVAVYRNINKQEFDRLVMPGSADPTTAAAADLDGDGDQDIIATSQDENIVYWYDNDGSESFTQRTIATGLQSVFGVAVADMDKDKDLDVVTGNHAQGIVYWYERIRALPKATLPSSIEQQADASGRITWQTTISDGDGDPTRLRVQYSTDGVRWHKPWLTNVVPSAGSVDLKNSNGYQIGTANAIDTNSHDSVTLTVTWDTKSTLNTGGALTGELAAVRLRLIPRDNKSIGATVTSAPFGVDNQAPKGLTGFKVNAVSETQIELGWQPPTDKNAIAYTVYYGADQRLVQDEAAEEWDVSKDEALDDRDTNYTTITGLQTGQVYYFKLVARDVFGNAAATPVISGTPATPGPGSPSPAPPAATSPAPAASPAPGSTVTPTPLPSGTPLPSEPAPVPPTTAGNQPPIGDAGPNQAVNPSALVILDGTASVDPDQDTLIYAWRQVAGPRVNLVSERTATPSFSAGEENESYVFALTVRDSKGASATDTVTVAVRKLPSSQAVAVPVGSAAPPPIVITPPVPLLVTVALEPANLTLFILSLAATALSLLERLFHSWRERRSGGGLNLGPQPKETPRGRIVHYRTGEPIVGAQVLVYGADGKLRASERTGAKGEFSTLFPAGQYTLGVEAPGFTFAPSLASGVKPSDGLVYTGGTLNVRDSNQPLTLVIPLKPTAQEVGSWRTGLLRSWQTIQHLGRIISWPIFVAGSLLNTVLVFWVPAGRYLVIEVSYVVLVIVKIILEVRLRPAYGLVRDAITHVPLDLAVVRLFETETNRLIMTRVTSAQGKFFALPPAGQYTITVTKPGYAVFSRDNVEITSEHDSALQITTDLMPVAPMGGLAQARAAVL